MVWATTSTAHLSPDDRDGLVEVEVEVGTVAEVEGGAEGTQEKEVQGIVGTRGLDRLEPALGTAGPATDDVASCLCRTCLRWGSVWHGMWHSKFLDIKTRVPDTSTKDSKAAQKRTTRGMETTITSSAKSRRTQRKT